MKHLYLLLVALLTCQWALAQLSTYPIEAPIQNVTVYQQGAQINRSGTLLLPAGKHTVLLKGLSPYVDAKSINISLPPQVTILSIQHQLDYLDTLSRAQNRQRLSNQIRQLEQKVAMARARKAVLDQKESLLLSNQQLNTQQQAVSIEKLRAFMAYYDQLLDQLNQEHLDLENQILGFQAQIQQLKKALTALGQKKALPSGHIKLTLSQEQAGNVAINYAYLVKNAGWYANYDIIAKNVQAPVELKYKAKVYQNTGVEWPNVRLSLSNANPAVNGSKPVLNKWELNYAAYTTVLSLEQQNRVLTQGLGHIGTIKGRITAKETGEPLVGANVIVRNKNYGAITNLNGEYELAITQASTILQISYIGYKSQEVAINGPVMNIKLEEDNTILNEVVVVGSFKKHAREGRAPGILASSAKQPKLPKTTVVNQTTTVSFTIETPYTIKSNGPATDVILNSYQLSTTYKHYAVPKIEEKAYLVAYISNWQQYQLLTGEANLFFENTFVGRTILNANALTDTLALSLGQDNGVQVSRQNTLSNKQTKIVGSNQEHSRRFALSFRNNKQGPIQLTVLDQIPVSVVSQIKVSATELSNGVLNEESGQIKWQFTLPPGAQQKVQLGYKVKYPKNQNVLLE